MNVTTGRRSGNCDMDNLVPWEDTWMILGLQLATGDLRRSAEPHWLGGKASAGACHGHTCTMKLMTCLSICLELPIRCGFEILKSHEVTIYHHMLDSAELVLEYWDPGHKNTAKLLKELCDCDEPWSQTTMYPAGWSWGLWERPLNQLGTVGFTMVTFIYPWSHEAHRVTPW